MHGVDQRVVRQGKQFFPHAFKQGIGIAVLKVCAPAPFNQQRIAREEPVTELLGCQLIQALFVCTGALLDSRFPAFNSPQPANSIAAPQTRKPTSQ